MDADAQTRTSTTRDRICPPGAGATDPAASARAAGADNGHAARPDPQESVQRLTRLIAELKEFAAYYLAARIDSIKASVRNLGIYAGLGLVGLIALSAFITTVVVLFLVGVAIGLNVLFGSPWLGPFLVGLVSLIAVALGVVFGMKMVMNSFRKATVNKYEQRQNWERGQFGRTVAEQAAASHNQ